MDPVTAFGLAAGVVQFVQFSNRLLKSSVKVYKASNPSSSKAESLDALCERLKGLSTKLSTSKHGISVNISQNDINLRDLAASCQNDCDTLLAKLEDLRARSGRRRFWKSLREALKDGSGMTQDSFQQMQERLRTYESSMSLHMCATLIESGESLHAEINAIGKEHKFRNQLAKKHEERLAEIEKNLFDILREIRALHTAPRPYTETGTQLERLTTQLEDLSVQNIDISRAQKVLASLKYPQRPIRHDNIPEAHRETFEWALKQPSAKGYEGTSYARTGQGDILKWIQSGHGAFWVSGKPGSGKSTFMKFLADHPDIRSALASWASPQLILVAVHYFWNSGTIMQKSEQGLWQSVLHDILWQIPDITPDICKQRWIEGPRTGGLDLGTRIEAPWSVAELRECLRQVTRQKVSGIRLCIFVDGLDESQGDHLDMVLFMAELCRSSTIKMCVSSRPWNVFEQSFGESVLSKIYMHELTRSDILNYTRSRLTEHPRWFDTVRPDEGQMLIEAITNRARGVFLWVFLVAKLLREGLTNGDTFEDLQVMLESFPPELEPFYQQMLDSVPSVYHSKMSGFLQLAISYHELDFRIYFFNEMEYRDLDFAAKETVLPVHEGEYIQNRLRMVARFDAICKGLLEIGADNIVGFIHRTVRDWSATEPVQRYLSRKTSSGFSTTLSALRATLAWFKHPRGTAMPWYPLVEPTGAFLCLAAEISFLNDDGSQHANTANGLLDGFFSAAHELAAQGFFRSKNDIAQALTNPSLLLQGLLIVGGFWDYLAAKLQDNDEYFTALSRRPAYVFALANHGLRAFEIQRKTCTSNREARVRSRVTKTILSLVLQHSIPSFRRFTGQRKENTSVGAHIDSALKLSRLLFTSFGTDSSIPWIPTISSTSTESKIRAWTGLFMLPFTVSLENFAKEYSQFLDCFGSQILNGGDCSLMFLQYDTKATIWDLLCEQVRALKTKRCGYLQESSQERLVRYVINTFSRNWSELLGAKESLRAAIYEGFPIEVSRRLIERMDKGYRLNGRDELDGHVFGDERYADKHVDNSSGIPSFNQGGQTDGTPQKHSVEPTQQRPQLKRRKILSHE